MSGVTGLIDRTSLSLAALPFGTGTGLSLYVGGLTAGRRKWRKTEVSSPFVPGDWETSAVLDQTDDTILRFRCMAASHSATKTIVDDLVTAVEQQNWFISIAVSGVSWPTLLCTRADTEVSFDTPHVRSHVASVLVYTTHYPTSGSL